MKFAHLQELSQGHEMDFCLKWNFIECAFNEDAANGKDRGFRQS
jgi:hypothetical protein